MTDINQHIIAADKVIRVALMQMDSLPSLEKRILFVFDNKRMVGTLSDGDIRRGLLRDLSLDSDCSAFMNRDFKFFYENNIDINRIRSYRGLDINMLPILNTNKELVSIIDFRTQKSLLPISALIMAGGKGERLKPLTDITPKPLLQVAGKPIIEYNIDRLKLFGINNQIISINYLGEQIKDYFKDGSVKNLNISYVSEDEPLGTLGALSLVQDITSDYILVMNSDLLTNIDYEDFYLYFKESGADFCVASIPYTVQIPYAVLKTEGDEVLSFEEKPSYTYYSSAGIYLMKKELKTMIPSNKFYNATDLMNDLIKNNKKVVHYALRSYWLDIGKPIDFAKAQEDVKHIIW